jgi:hypothetical protein
MKPQKLTKRDSESKDGHRASLALSPLARLGIGVPAKQPIQADVEGIGNVAKPIKRKVNGRRRKIAAGVSRQAGALRDLLRRELPCLTCIYKTMRELRNVCHLLAPLAQLNTYIHAAPQGRY